MKNKHILMLLCSFIFSITASEKPALTAYEATKELYMAVISNKFTPEIYEDLIHQGATTDHCPLYGLAGGTLLDVAITFKNPKAHAFLAAKGVKQTEASLINSVKEVLVGGTLEGLSRFNIEQYGSDTILPEKVQSWIKQEYVAATDTYATLSAIEQPTKEEEAEKIVQCSRVKSMAVLMSKLVKKSNLSLSPITSHEQLSTIFPKTVAEINARIAQALEQAQQDVAAIINIPHAERTFYNTMRAFDALAGYSPITLTATTLRVFDLLHPDKELREAAHKGFIKLNEFNVDVIMNNVHLYRAIKAYADEISSQEQLSEQERYFIKITLEDFKRAGLDLPQEKLTEVKKLKKEIITLGLDFHANISNDARHITVDRAALAGLEDEFINSLKQDADGLYILGTDYPTTTMVLNHCTLADTRCTLYRAFVNRAYPQNEAILQTMIAKRDELANLLGFTSYAALDIDGQMAQTPEMVEKFLAEVTAKSSLKAAQEFDMLLTDLPDSVCVTQEKMQSWDIDFAQAQYAKKYYEIDELEIAQYFPMEKTVKGLLSIYERFFNLSFKQVPAVGLWHEDLKVIQVCSVDDNQLLGHLILDLHPRPFKNSHAAHVGVVPSLKDGKGVITPTVSVVFANLPRATANRPALLKRREVTTFFHEFGHAMHFILGRTELATQAGTRVLRDFVEMPSQMLELWLEDKEILTSLSSHYETGEQLPDALLEKIMASEKLFSGLETLRQCIHAQLSYTYYKTGAQKDVNAILKELSTDIMQHVVFDENNHKFASFFHLTDYGAKYYGYLWSQVYASDLFEMIKEEGLLSPEAGARYVKEVLGKGGSEHPMQLLESFLGRKPNQEAFLKHLGLM